MQDKDVAAGGETPPVRITEEFATLLQRFVREQIGDEAVLMDWFVAFGAMKQSDDSPTGIAYATRYLTSDSSPQGSIGIAHIGICDMEADITGQSCCHHDDDD